MPLSLSVVIISLPVVSFSQTDNFAKILSASSIHPFLSSSYRDNSSIALLLLAPITSVPSLILPSLFLSMTRKPLPSFTKCILSDSPSASMSKSIVLSESPVKTPERFKIIGSFLCISFFRNQQNAIGF